MSSNLSGEAEDFNRVDEFIQLVCSMNCRLMDGDGGKDFQQAKRMLVEDADVASSNVFAAAASGQWEAVTSFLTAEPELAKAKGGPRDWTALLYLCFSRFFRDDDEAALTALRKTAKLLLKSGADPNAFFMLGDEKETCLYGACGVVNDGPLAEMLLQHGANVNDEDASYHVAEFQQHDCIKALLDHGLDADRSATVLLRKLDFEDLAGIQKMLDWGVDANHGGYWGKTPLHQAIMRGRSEEIIQLLLDRGADPKAIRKDGASAYLLACQFGRCSIVDLLLKHGASSELNEVDSFLAACGLGDHEKANAALGANGQLLAELSEQQKSLFSTAGSCGNTPGLRVMLKAGFDIGTTDNQGFTALHWAAWYGHLDCARFLIENGASVNAKNNYGGTVIDSTVWSYANSNGNAVNCDEILRLLVDSGADPYSVSPYPSGHEQSDAVIQKLRDTNKK